MKNFERLFESLSIMTMFICCTCFSTAQNTFPSTGSAGIGTTTPNASSILDMVSKSKGMLVPRMTKTQRDAIATPATGLFIYQTNSTPGFYYYSGSVWAAVSTKGANISLSNLGTTSINKSLIPSITNATDLGNSALGWKDVYTTGSIYLDGTKFIDNSGTDNTFIGNTGNITNTGSSNTMAGKDAGASNTIGFCNSFFGKAAGVSNTEGYYNSFFGQYAGASNTTGIYNTANGFDALGYNITGYYNTASGFEALYYNTAGYYNTAIGVEALYFDTSGHDNSATGIEALYHNTTGNYNSANGNYALYYSTTGYSNTANGFQALRYNTSGYGNTAIGDSTLFSNTTGNKNTALGSYADVSTGNLTNATAIGFSAKVDASNKVRVGSANITSIGGQVGWSSFSDGRYKKNIKKDVQGLAFINSLQPITYTVDITGLNEYYDKGRKHDSSYEKMKAGMKESTDKAATIVFNGFIAQDVEAAAKKLNYNFSGIDKPQTKDGLYGLRYGDFVVPLVKAVQELSKQNDSLKETNQGQQQMISNLIARLDKLEQSITTLQQCSPCNTSGANTQTYNTAITDVASLEQNTPNPFNRSTDIRYTLPAKFISAQIIITDQTGKVLKQVNISSLRKGTLNIQAGLLAAGTYNYSLIVDARLVDTKKMILLK